VTSPAGPLGPYEVAPEASPRCYRHQERETWVRCTRCERPICPDCMHSAAVGFQCPDCVAAGNRGARPARTALGGRIQARTGQVTMTLIGLNVLAFLAQLANPHLQYEFGLLGAARYSFDPATVHGVAEGEYYRLITSAFLHANLLHIGFNMYALYLVGPQLEAALGRARFASLYFVSALAGSTLAYVLAPPNSLGVGASGAIFGLFAGLLVVARRFHLDVRPIAALIGINLVFTFAIRGISWQAHIGGLVAGGLWTLIMAYAPPRARSAVAVAGPVVMLGICAVAVALRTAALTG
jgi:membrane associated rhomboid family serine protease